MRRSTAIASLPSSPSTCNHVCLACIIYQTSQVPAAVTLQNEVKGREVQWRHIQGPNMYHTATCLTKISKTAVGLLKGERNTYCRAYEPVMLYVQSLLQQMSCCSMASHAEGTSKNSTAHGQVHQAANITLCELHNGSPAILS